MHAKSRDMPLLLLKCFAQSNIRVDVVVAAGVANNNDFVDLFGPRRDFALQRANESGEEGAFLCLSVKLCEFAETILNNPLTKAQGHIPSFGAHVLSHQQLPATRVDDDGSYVSPERASERTKAAFICIISIRHLVEQELGNECDKEGGLPS